MGSCCAGNDTSSDNNIVTGGEFAKPNYNKKRKGKGTINSNPGPPNNDKSIYNQIYSDIFDGDGVKTTPRFTVKISEDELQQ